MDSSANTRQQFTEAFASREIPADASTSWQEFAEKLQKLLKHLGEHESMKLNMSQPYATSANQTKEKNHIFFMWDFTGRTLSMLYSLPPTSQPGEGEAGVKSKWTDVMGRSEMAADLILNEPPGMMKMMIESLSPELAKSDLSFPDEIIADAKSFKVKSMMTEA